MSVTVAREFKAMLCMSVTVAKQIEVLTFHPSKSHRTDNKQLFSTVRNKSEGSLIFIGKQFHKREQHLLRDLSLVQWTIVEESLTADSLTFKCKKAWLL